MTHSLKCWSATDDEDTKIIRGLGCHEGYQLACQTLDQYRGTIVACRYSPPLGLTSPENLDTLKSKFCDAVVRVALKQPHLQTGVIGENSKNPNFVRIERLNLRDHIVWKTLTVSDDMEAQYQEVLQSELEARFSNLSTRPGWKVVVLHIAGTNRMEVLYIWNHLHHDGMSAKIFHRQLLQNLNEKAEPNNKPVFQLDETSDRWNLELPDSSDKLPPPPEVLCAFSTTAPFFVKEIWNAVKPYSIFPGHGTHALWAPIQTSAFATQYHTFTVNSSTVEKVVSACRQHDTTVTALLHSLVMLSLAFGLKEMKGFASRTPYDLRHILPSHTEKYPWLQPKEAMCNYVSVVDHEFQPELIAAIRATFSADQTPGKPSLSKETMEYVWPTSARVRQEIKARLDLGVQNDMIPIMKLVSDWRTQQESEVKKPRYFSWLVTNIGVLEGGLGEQESNNEKWSVDRAELVLSTEVASAAISVSVATVKGGDMAVTCSWQNAVVDPDLGSCLIENLERWLKEIGS